MINILDSLLLKWSALTLDTSVIGPAFLFSLLSLFIILFISSLMVNMHGQLVGRYFLIIESVLAISSNQPLTNHQIPFMCNLLLEVYLISFLMPRASCGFNGMSLYHPLLFPLLLLVQMWLPFG